MQLQFILLVCFDGPARIKIEEFSLYSKGKIYGALFWRPVS